MSTFYSLPKPLVCVICAALLPQSPTLLAQGLVLEEVIITSQLREESLQDVSVSVTVMAGDKLFEAGIDKIEDLQAYVPNLTMSETGIGTNIYIRGIGSGINQGFEQSTGMYVDGVSYGRAQLSRAPFLDLERIEVLRGPQNILFGKNSIAGALSIATAKPSKNFEGTASILYEPEHGEEVFDLILSGPLFNSIGARLAYRNRTTDGYIENITTGKDEPSREEETIRLTFDWQANENLDLSLKLEHSEFDISGRQVEVINEEPLNNALSPLNGLTYSQILFAAFGADRSVLNNTQDYKRSSTGDSSENSTNNITLTVNYPLGDNALTFITGFMEYQYDENCDCDFTAANIFTLQSEEEYQQFSQELRFTSPLGEKIEYIAGAYIQFSELEFRDQVFIGANSILPAALNANPSFMGTMPGDALSQTTVPRLFTTDTDLYSVFLQSTWNISDSLRLIVAGRYSNEKKDGSRSLTYTDLSGNELPVNFGTPFALQPWGVDAVYALAFKVERHDLSASRSEDDFSPMIGLEYSLNDDFLFYGTLSQGSKSGGFDARSNTNPKGGLTGIFGSFEYENEKATSVELGTKTTLLNGAAELNIALFYTEYEDLQVSIYDGTFGFNVGNAGEATTRGLEVDGRWRVTENFTLSGALALLDFEFTDYPNGQCNFGEAPTNANGDCDFKGRTNQYAADWSGSLTGEYVSLVSQSLEVRAAIDLMFTDDYNPSQTLDPGLDQEGFTKVGARVSISDINKGWELALVGKNLSNKTIISYGNYSPLSGESFGVASRYAFYERDRSVALQGVYRF